jgi:Arc/MetJ-type ribon-helix-helix transcriptional regulator
MMPRKTISLPEDLADFVDENHINLSRFVQDKLRELSESRDIEEEDQDDLSEEEAKEIAKKLEKLGYLDR